MFAPLAIAWLLLSAPPGPAAEPLHFSFADLRADNADVIERGARGRFQLMIRAETATPAAQAQPRPANLFDVGPLIRPEQKPAAESHDPVLAAMAFAEEARAPTAETEARRIARNRSICRAEMVASWFIAGGIMLSFEQPFIPTGNGVTVWLPDEHVCSPAAQTARVHLARPTLGEPPVEKAEGEVTDKEDMVMGGHYTKGDVVTDVAISVGAIALAAWIISGMFGK